MCVSVRIARGEGDSPAEHDLHARQLLSCIRAEKRRGAVEARSSKNILVQLAYH